VGLRSRVDLYQVFGFIVFLSFLSHLLAVLNELLDFLLLLFLLEDIHIRANIIFPVLRYRRVQESLEHALA